MGKPVDSEYIERSRRRWAEQLGYRYTKNLPWYLWPEK